MKSGDRVKLTIEERFSHFGTSIFLLIPTIIFGYFWVEDSEDLYLFPLVIFLGISIFFFWVNWNRLFFQKYKAKLTDEEFIKAVQVTAKELNWQVSKLEESYAEAFRFPEAFEAGSERITVKKTNDRLSINSIGNPELSGQGYSRKKNKENVDIFLLNTRSILEGKDVEEIIIERQKRKEEEFWKESEWTIGRTLKRIIGYGLVLIFLLIGVLIIYEGAWEGLFFLLSSLGLGFTYVKNDILILVEKNRRKKSNLS